MPSHPNITIFCYLTSQLLDAFDGHAARALGQSKCFLIKRKDLRGKI